MTKDVLTRAIGFWALAAAIVNVTIGGSIFALPSVLAQSLGAAAPLAFILGALLFIPITLCFAAAGSRITATGGPYRYVETAFGPFPGFVIAILLWISNVSGAGSMLAVLADQLSRALPFLEQPVPRAAFLFCVFAALVGLNARGVRIGAAAIVAFAAAKVVPLLLLAVVGVGYVDLDNFHVPEMPPWSAFAASLVIVVFAYSGIETALLPSGEVRDTSKVVPRAALLGVGVVIALYVSLQAVAIGVVGSDLSGKTAPLAVVADRIVVGSGWLIVLTATLSLFGVQQGLLLSSSRLLYALASDGFLPAPLARVTKKRRVPIVAVVAHALIAWLMSLYGTFTSLALVSGGAFCLVYIGGCAAAWQLERKQLSETEQPLRLRGGPLIPAISVAGLIVILTTLQNSEWIAIGSATAAVTVLYALTRWMRRQN